jgi:membrane protein CcdC involved in cytochrome C biogenesis
MGWLILPGAAGSPSPLNPESSAKQGSIKLIRLIASKSFEVQENSLTFKKRRSDVFVFTLVTLLLVKDCCFDFKQNI